MNAILRQTGHVRALAILAVTAVVTACSGGQTPPAGRPARPCPDRARRRDAGGADQINGAGATFPYPIYSKWFSEYTKSHPDVRINYQSIGSGGGIRQLTPRPSSSAPRTAR
jgi:ABC-type phosphate transport system substrate-binding protein